jgi:PPK2 family polyphosphate:nucleotide phosphotransferase
MKASRYTVPPGKTIRLKDFPTSDTGPFKEKEEAAEKLEKDIARLAELQDILYAQDRYALLIIIQAMDAAGKDSVIKHVMSGINPQGCQVYSFKAPSAEELDHDFLWRCMQRVPERGRIGIFNRSYYEEVLVVRVRPDLLAKQHLPPEAQGKDIWKNRYDDINDHERYLVRNGIHILKFFLHVSREEQKKRFLARIEEPEKNWKFSLDDLATRAEWGKYMEAYEAMLNHTSTSWAPWHVIPADHKWFTRALVADCTVKKLESLDLRYPVVTEQHRGELRKARRMLEQEGKQ